MKKVVLLLAMAGGATALTGCVEKGAKADAPKAKDGLMKEAFSPPAPSAPADDPRVINAKSASQAITLALGNVRDRVTVLWLKLEMPPTTRDNMAAVAQELRSMVQQARDDCDAVLRAAEDLRAELRHARDAYDAAAHSYRSRARGYREKFYRQTDEVTAEQLERLAADTPRRIRVTDRFVEAVVEAREFLAETNRFLHSIESTVAILSVAPEVPRPNPKAEHVKHYLGQFMGVVEQFRDDLLKSPGTKEPDASAAPSPKAEPSRSDPEEKREGPTGPPPPSPGPAAPDASGMPRKPPSDGPAGQGQGAAGPPRPAQATASPVASESLRGTCHQTAYPLPMFAYQRVISLN